MPEPVSREAGAYGWSGELPPNPDFDDELELAARLFGVLADSEETLAAKLGLKVFDPGGGEHSVYYRASDNRLVKVSKRQTGFVFALKEGEEFFKMRLGSPREYLRRLRICNQVFADDMKIIGVIRDKSGCIFLVHSQTYRGDIAPSPEQIHRHMLRLGFAAVASRIINAPLFHGNTWYHLRHDILLADCRPPNFRDMDGSLFAIDIVAAKLDERSRALVVANLDEG
jgi:hypothetical protein